MPRRLLFLLTSVVVALAISGCGDGPNTSTSGSDGDAAKSRRAKNRERPTPDLADIGIPVVAEGFKLITKEGSADESGDELAGVAAALVNMDCCKQDGDGRFSYPPTVLVRKYLTDGDVRENAASKREQLDETPGAVPASYEERTVRVAGDVWTRTEYEVDFPEDDGADDELPVLRPVSLFRVSGEHLLEFSWVAAGVDNGVVEPQLLEMLEQIDWDQVPTKDPG